MSPDEVVVTWGTDVVARYDRVLARHVTVTDPAHDAARRARAELARLPAPEPGDTDVEQRDLGELRPGVGGVA